MHLPITETENLILSTVERELLDGGVFAEALDIAIARLSREAPQLSALTSERDRLTRELSNLAAAVAAGGDVPTLVAETRKRELRRAELERHLTRPKIDAVGLRRALERRLRDWKALLRAQPVHGQSVLKTLLSGPIASAQKVADGVPWEVEGALSGVLSTLSHQGTSPPGFEPGFQP